jgi:hypothetical protein
MSTFIHFFQNNIKFIPFEKNKKRGGGIIIFLWFSPGTPISFSNKTDRNNTPEMLLKVPLNTITPLELTFLYDFFSLLE